MRNLSRATAALLLLATAVLVWGAARRMPIVRAQNAAPAPTAIPSYAKDGSLVLPRDYREWVFLSAGLDMTYGPKTPEAGHHMFNNVFVNPAAYRSFLRAGTWPDKTMFVLEIRGAETQASINRGGQTQGRDIMGLEVHLKDEQRFPGKWAFFDVNDAGLGKLFEPTATCYSCHRDHAAADTTFAQFYPTILPVAEAKHTLSPEYLKELSAAPAAKP